MSIAHNKCGYVGDDVESLTSMISIQIASKN